MKSSAKGCQSAGCSGTTINLVDVANICSLDWATTTGPLHEISIHLYNDPAHREAPVTAAGNFTVWNKYLGRGQEPAKDVASFSQDTKGDSNPELDFAGTVTITRIDGDIYEGSFAVQHGTESISGAFHPRACPSAP